MQRFFSRHYQPTQHGFDFHDTEPGEYSITPQEDVYSYLMFVAPMEKARGKSISVDICFAYFLVLLAVAIQGTVLYAIWDKVVIASVTWEMGIVNTGTLANTILYNTQGMGEPGYDWDLLKPIGSKCNEGKSLCTIENGMYTCAPPTIQFAGRWDELDVNKDGVWTINEVLENRDALQCKYIVDPKLVFDVFINTMKLHSEKYGLWVHPDVVAGHAIPEAYFTYAKADIIMCLYRSSETCANAFANGYFDMALKYRTAARVGNTTRQALDYCYELTRPGGTCESLLPSTYGVWKIFSNQECKAKTYTPFPFTNPGTGEEKMMLKIDHKAHTQYMKVNTTMFITYKTVIIGIWCLQMCYEMKCLLIVITLLLRFPGKGACDAEGKELTQQEDDGTFTVNGIACGHRFQMGIIMTVRSLMLIILSVAGTSLLLNSPEYMSLIFDAVSLVFVIEICQIIYANALREKIRTEVTENINEIKVPMFGFAFFTRRPGLIDFLYLLCVMGAACTIMYVYYRDSVGPLMGAIQCNCISEGERCREAQIFGKEFWDKYWKDDIPRVMEENKRMEYHFMNNFVQLGTEAVEVGAGAIGQVRALSSQVATPLFKALRG